jgi:hypothetical protein
MGLNMNRIIFFVFSCLILISSAVNAGDVSALNGDWYSYKWKYGYSLKNGKGVAFATNSPNFKVGQEIIRLTEIGDNEFIGENVYKDGKFYKVKATLESDGRLVFEGEKNVRWEMNRIGIDELSKLKGPKTELADSPLTKEPAEEARGGESLAKSSMPKNETPVLLPPKAHSEEPDNQTNQEQSSKGGMGSFSMYHWIILAILIGIGIGIFLLVKKIFTAMSKGGKPMSAGKFLFIYLFFMLPTYVWRWVFAAGAVGAAMSNDGDSESAINSMRYATYVLLTISYVVMCFAAHRRGAANNRKFLIAFPLVGGFFDIVLGFIPFVPTIFNVLAIVFGSMSRAREEESDNE